MDREMDTEYFAQHIQCTREGKQECLITVRQLVELAFAAQQSGLLKMDEMIQDYARYPDPFLRKAVALAVEISNADQIRKVLFNFIITSKHLANHQFLSEVVITETICALSRGDDLDYVFTYLVPSYFGIEYEGMVVDVYRKYKQALFNASKTGK